MTDPRPQAISSVCPLSSELRGGRLARSWNNKTLKVIVTQPLPWQAMQIDILPVADVVPPSDPDRIETNGDSANDGGGGGGTVGDFPSTSGGGGGGMLGDFTSVAFDPRGEENFDGATPNYGMDTALASTILPSDSVSQVMVAADDGSNPVPLLLTPQEATRVQILMRKRDHIAKANWPYETSSNVWTEGSEDEDLKTSF